MNRKQIEFLNLLQPDAAAYIVGQELRKMRQEYLCDACGVESHVYLDEDEGVWSAVEKIKADHRKWSPECTGEPRVLVAIAPNNQAR